MTTPPEPPFDPPYYAVIFTSNQTGRDPEGYGLMAAEMMSLAARQPGYLGVDTARGDDGLGITVSYWRDLASIRAWKQNVDHKRAQDSGRAKWYSAYTLHIARVERSYRL